MKNKLIIKFKNQNSILSKKIYPQNWNVVLNKTFVFLVLIKLLLVKWYQTHFYSYQTSPKVKESKLYFNLNSFKAIGLYNIFKNFLLKKKDKI